MDKQEFYDALLTGTAPVRELLQELPPEQYSDIREYLDVKTREGLQSANETTKTSTKPEDWNSPNLTPAQQERLGIIFWFLLHFDSFSEENFNNAEHSYRKIRKGKRKGNTMLTF